MITVENLTKSYGSFTAVRDVSFTCRPGRVTGFLGPNGAGKSTTLRMMCGLTPPSTGATYIDGTPYIKLTNPGYHIGVMLDASAQHPGRTGREVLTLGVAMVGAPKARVDEILPIVGLTPQEAGRRVRNYSLGMRQRLDVGVALAGNPRTLILDEPANGLDPAGIRWMRQLLREFADRGGTVLLSSHLLGEIELVADDIVVIDGGRIARTGETSALLASATTLVRSSDDDVLLAALKTAGLAATPAAGGGVISEARPALLADLVAAAGLSLHELRPAGSGLEELFLSLTQAREGAQS